MIEFLKRWWAFCNPKPLYISKEHMELIAERDKAVRQHKKRSHLNKQIRDLVNRELAK